MKYWFSSICICLVCLLFALPASAHPGRTDSNGGHHSSSSYHYHHGYPAHQHTSGICPYAFDDKTGVNSGASSHRKDVPSATVTSDKEESNSEKTPTAAIISNKGESNNMEDILLYIGFSFVLYYVSSWLHYFYLRFEDQQQRPVLQHICFWTSFIAGLLAFPVTLPCLFLNSKKADRLSKISEKEGYDKGYSIGCTDAPEVHAAYNLVTRYAARMNMSVSEYISWCDAQERNRQTTESR